MRSLFAITVLLMLASHSPADPFLVAHRGASGDAPENTLPAFKLAWEQGADAIEGDFHLTRDHHIVCIHDHDTKKVAGKKLQVHESTLAELRAFDVGKWKDPKFAGTRIPTFAEVCATIPDGKKIYIEIKCGPEIVPFLVEEVAKCHLPDPQIVVISFNAKVIRAVKAARPQWVANWLCSFDTKKDSDPDRRLPAILTTLETSKANALGSNSHQGLTREHIDQLREAGFQHHVWTVNDAKTARHFLAIGSRSVTTDFPGRLREALENP